MRVLLFILLFFGFLFSKSITYSSLSIPKAIYIDVSTTKCDNQCQLYNLANGNYFDFLSTFDKNSSDEYLQKEYKVLAKIFKIDQLDDILNIALIMPRKMIGRYSVTTANSTLAVIASSGEYFDFETYDIDTEDISNISEAIQEVDKKNTKYLIAVLTKEGAENLSQINSNSKIYIPTVNKKDINSHESSIYFGGISYQKQVEKLAKMANQKVVIFNDDSLLSQSLTNMQEKILGVDAHKVNIESSKINFKDIIKRNINKFQNATIFLNTPLVKSSLVAAQLRYYEVNPFILLSTQINYNPFILTLTQYQDRKELFIANAISKFNPSVEAYAITLGSDIAYDWIDYSTALGVDYFLSEEFGEKRNFYSNFEDNQIIYDIQILNPGYHSFK